MPNPEMHEKPFWLMHTATRGEAGRGTLAWGYFDPKSYEFKPGHEPGKYYETRPQEIKDADSVRVWEVDRSIFNWHGRSPLSDSSPASISWGFRELPSGKRFFTMGLCVPHNTISLELSLPEEHVKSLGNNLGPEMKKIFRKMETAMKQQYVESKTKWSAAWVENLDKKTWNYFVSRWRKKEEYETIGELLKKHVFDSDNNIASCRNHNIYHAVLHILPTLEPEQIYKGFWGDADEGSLSHELENLPRSYGKRVFGYGLSSEKREHHKGLLDLQEVAHPILVKLFPDLYRPLKKS